MKTTIILLATIAGIGIAAASQASASDAENLSCITEIAANGATVRDCEPKPVVIARKVEVIHAPAAPIAPDRGGKSGDRGGAGGQGGNGGPNN